MKKLWASILIAALLLGMTVQPTVAWAQESEYYIKINRQQNCVTIYTKDAAGKYTVPVRACACSTGANNATPKGTFKLGTKYRWHELDGHVFGQYSTRITGHVLFHSVYYHTTDPGTLYHNAYNQLGSSVSHGCVRLCVADAKWIYDNCPEGTTVEIYDGADPGPLGKPNTVKISSSHANRGWDPTDPDPANPWKLSAPTFTGVGNKTIERGAAKSKLLAGVKAVDFAGNLLEVQVTDSCNLNKIGKYKVTYRAVDALGSVSRKQVTITVQDTKKPKVSLTQKELELTDEDGEFSTVAELKTYLKQYVVAKDSGVMLPDKYIHLVVKDLWNAWKTQSYGTYRVSVYATDAAGNRSAEKTLTVCYLAPDIDEEPDEESDGEPSPDAGETSEPAGTEEKVTNHSEE